MAREQTVRSCQAVRRGGNDPPTDTASSVRVTLDKIGGRWLISAFEPV
jgi:hypothetical protein